MSTRNYSFGTPANPILQVLYFVVGGVLLIGAILMSAVILAFVLGLALIVGVAVFARIWWIKRKLMRSGRMPGQGTASSSDAEVLEVEYRVVSEKDDPDA